MVIQCSKRRAEICRDNTDTWEGSYDSKTYEDRIEAFIKNKDSWRTRLLFAGDELDFLEGEHPIWALRGLGRHEEKGRYSRQRGHRKSIGVEAA